MKTQDIRNMGLAYLEVLEANKAVNKHGHDHVGKEDPDVNNDKKVDSTDKYLLNRRKAISANIRKEETEELDELSKKTLGSYTKAAANDIGHLQRDITNREPGYKGLQAKRNNRRDGIERAVDRLTKEEVEELDELSSDTLASYNSKANVSRAKAIGSMRNTAGGMDFAVHKKRLDKRDAGIKTATSKYHKKLNTNEEVELDESWSDGISSRNAHMHASTAAKYRKKANDSAAMARNYDKGSLGHSKNMANHHSAMAKSIKSSYHAGDYGSLNTAKRDHKAQMDKSKEYKSSMSEEVDLDEVSKKTLGSYRTKAALSDKDRSKGRNLSSAKMYPDQYKNSPLKAKVVATEEVEHIDEISAVKLGQYSTQAARQGGSNKRVAGQKMADEKVRKKYGYSSSAKVAAGSLPKKEATEWPVFARIQEKLTLPSYKVSGIGDDPHEVTVKYATDPHTKGATPPEKIDSKASDGEKDFIAKHGGLGGNDSGINAHQYAAKNSVAHTTNVKVAPGRHNDQKTGDKAPLKSKS